MPGAMRKMAVYLGLVEEGEDQYDEYSQSDASMDQYERAVVAQRPAPRPTSRATGDYEPAVVPASRPTPAVIDTGRITTMVPRTYNDARGIGLEYREGTPVIMNLTEMDDADCKRLVDFAAGLVFAQRGAIQRITNKVFLLSPANVDVTEQARAEFAQGGFFNQS